MRFLSALIGGLALFVGLPAAATPFSQLIVFGDSIVDAGNTQNLVVGLGGPDPTPAAFGYYEGRFGNGPNFVDLLNQQISGANSVASSEGGTNFAFGGARARTEGDIVPDLTAQVTTFLTAFGGVADPDALYVVHAGGNDIRDILLDGLNPTIVIGEAVTAIATEVGTLAAAGAQHILVAGVANVGAIPSVAVFGPAAQAAVAGLSMAFNDTLDLGHIPIN